MRNNIEELRRAAGMTQEQVADFLKVTRQKYYSFETGKAEPNIKQVDALCCLFACDVYQLFEMDSKCNYDYNMGVRESNARNKLIDEMVSGLAV